MIVRNFSVIFFWAFVFPVLSEHIAVNRLGPIESMTYAFISCMQVRSGHQTSGFGLLHTLVISPSIYPAVCRSLVVSHPSMKNVSRSAVVIWIVYTEDGRLVDPPLKVNVRLTQVRRKSA